MTALAEKTSSLRAPRTKGPLLAGDPTVQLLPPAVRDRAKNRDFRRLMVMLLVLAVVVVVGGVAYGLFRSVQAQDALAAAHAETARLLAEQETYRADAAVADVVAGTEQAQQLVTTTEVDWQLLLEDIDDALGSRADVTAATVATPLPWDPAPTSPGLLRPAPTIVTTLTVVGPNVLRIADLTDRFAELPGFVEAYFDSTTQAEDGYTSSVVLSFDPTRFMGRYAVADAAPADTATETGTETDQAEGVEQ